MSLVNQRPRKNTPPQTGWFKYLCSVNKTGGGVVGENNGEAVWGCADRIVSLNTRGGVYFACLSGRSYLTPGERSVMTSGFSVQCTNTRACPIITGKKVSLLDCR